MGILILLGMGLAALMGVPPIQIYFAGAFAMLCVAYAVTRSGLLLVHAVVLATVAVVRVQFGALFDNQAVLASSFKSIVGILSGDGLLCTVAMLAYLVVLALGTAASKIGLPSLRRRAVLYHVFRFRRPH